jgi:hypothetical protein
MFDNNHADFGETILSEPTQCIVEGSSPPAYRFNGWKVAHVSSERANSWRWTELTAWTTEGGKWIVQEVGRSTIEGETDFIKREVFNRAAEIPEKMGIRRLSLVLYRKIGLNFIDIA